MSKPQWKVIQEEKERVTREREEAEKVAKAQKLASLGSESHADDVVPVKHSEVPEELPELGLVDKEESLDIENKRLQRHLTASDANAPKKSEEQVAKEKKVEDEKLEAQARSDALLAKMKAKMAQHQQHAPSKPSSGLVITTEEEEFDEEAKKKQAAMVLGKYIGK